VTTTAIITMHPSMVSTVGVAFVAIGVLTSAWALLSTMATPTAYATPAYSPYAGHAAESGPASARPIREAVGQPQSACINPVRVFSGAYVSRNGQRTGVGDHIVGAKWDGYAGTGERFEHTIRGSLDARFDEVGTVARAPAIGVVGVLDC